ncbi:MAG: hypothetical protein OEO71_10115 [Gammaproteobacteria bacterium]|nr:hypothetical protein [Gammaproteobacteria bacterium]
MTRSPLAYPLNRSADMDSGGAADLQTDIMRFMAILSLCLVAIFALVQSIPMTPAPPVEPEPQHTPVEPTPIVEKVPLAAPPKPAVPKTVENPVEKPVEKPVTLTHPKWVPKFQPAQRQPAPVKVVPEVQAAAPAMPEASPPVIPPLENEAEGFTLRFESDAALTRLVAASRVGLYAIESDRAQRMTVSNSRISFWDASMPNTYHEMETATVPAAVFEALNRTGIRADAVSWGVTLPGKLKTQLDDLMQAHGGGALVIGASGDIRWEAS